MTLPTLCSDAEPVLPTSTMYSRALAEMQTAFIEERMRNTALGVEVERLTKEVARLEAENERLRG